jgi:hypothetical protein
MFVGITENYRRSLAIINRRFGLNIKHRRDNPGSGGGGKKLCRRLDPTLVKRFYELNDEDMRLYETALNRFEKDKIVSPSKFRFGK